MPQKKQVGPTALRELLTAMRGLVSWEFARGYLKNANLPVAQGWDRTISQSKKEQLDLEVHRALARHFVEHVAFGNKSVRLFEMSKRIPVPNSVNAMAIKAEEIDDVTQKLIDGPAPAKPTPILALRGVEGTGIVFNSMRMVENRVHLQRGEYGIPDAVFDEFGELVAFRREKKRVFDVAWIPFSGHLELRIDCDMHATSDYVIRGHQALESAVSGLLGGPALANRVNVFNAIKGIYRKKTEGHVVELGFQTNTGSIKHERMRRKSCLREELFHKKGAEAVGDGMELFKIGVSWPKKATAASLRPPPELLIRGSSRLLSHAAPEIAEFLVTKCANEQEFRHVVDRVVSYL